MSDDISMGALGENLSVHNAIKAISSRLQSSSCIAMGGCNDIMRFY